MKRYSWLWILLWGNVMIGSAGLSAQDTTQVTTEEQVTEVTEEEEEMIKSRMSLTCEQYPDATIILKGLLRARIDGSYQKIPGEKISFFMLNADGEEISLGEATTKADGTGQITAEKNKLTAGADGSYALIVRFDGNDKMDGSESDLMVWPATLAVEAQEADSVYTLRLTAMAEGPDGPQPIAAAPVAVYVKRMFSSLKVVEGETDEAGIAELEFPSGLPGDPEGILHITALIEEHETYGNLAAQLEQPWGQPVSDVLEKTPRALWSPHPPTWMVFTFFILMGTVWGHYGIIIYNLFRIKTGRPSPESRS